jgi:hypothetical protein
MCPTLKPGKYGHASTSAPSVEELNLNPTRQDRKKGVLVNTPTLTWVYMKTFKEMVKKNP